MHLMLPFYGLSPVFYVYNNIYKLFFTTLSDGGE